MEPAASSTNTATGSPSNFRRRYTLNTEEFSNVHRRVRIRPAAATFASKYPTLTKCLYGMSTMFVMCTLSVLVARNFGVVEVNMNNVEHGIISSRRLGVKSRHVHVGENSPIKTIYISDSTRHELERELTPLQVDTSNLQELNSFIQESKEILLNHLDPTVLKTLRQLHNTSSPISAIQFRNLPVDPYVPPNPLNGELSLNKPTYVAEALLTALGELSGAHVVGYASEKEYSNPWIHEGFPRAGKGSALTKASELSFHQDMSYTDPPDVLGLVCVREGYDTVVQTELLDIRELLETLPDAIVSLLKQPRFQIQTSAWVDTSSLNTNTRRPILQDYSLALPVDWENMIALDQPAQQALDMMQAAILNGGLPHYVHFATGDLVLFSNVRVVHARTPYTDLRLDGNDRTLYRSYFKKDLTAQQRKLRMME